MLYTYNNYVLNSYITILIIFKIIISNVNTFAAEFLHVCQVRAPEQEYETCILNSINYLRPYLKMGVPEYNIPSLEPLKLKKLSLSLTKSLRILLTDVSVEGASNFEINEVK